MSTILRYLEHMQELTCDASVERIEQKDERYIVYLDQTILYPQGGGQPYDTGTIQNSDTIFVVEEVRYADDSVLHYGHFSGRPFLPGENVRVAVDGERRTLNARLHTAGHLVDVAVSKLGLEWMPGKGYHFPDGPYVEYGALVDVAEREKLRLDIERVTNDLIAQDLPVSCRFIERGELQQICRHVPNNLPAGKPARIVQFAGFAVPCGGTHVASLADLRHLVVTKLKQKGQNVKVGYDVER